MAVSSSPLNQLESTLDLYLGQKAPALPANWKEVLVKVAPWVVLVLLVLSLPAVLALLGIGALLSPLSFAAGGAMGGATYMLSMVLLIISLVLEALAIPGLFKKSRQGWTFLYYSTLVSIVSSLVSFNVIGGLLFSLISLYLLFQVKNLYT